jgi:urease accessory protein
MAAEVLCPGRLLRGESFHYRKLDNRLRVYYGDELIFHQRQIVLPAEHRLASPGSWEDQTHLGTLYVFADFVSAAHLQAAREAFSKLPGHVDRPIQVGASLTYRHGLVVMASSTTAWTVQEVLREVWTALRGSMLGLPAIQFLHS